VLLLVPGVLFGVVSVVKQSMADVETASPIRHTLFSSPSRVHEKNLGPRKSSRAGNRRDHRD
jgi:hypothetical protein